MTLDHALAKNYEDFVMCLYILKTIWLSVLLELTWVFYHNIMEN